MSNAIVEKIEGLNKESQISPDESSLKFGNTNTCIKRKLVSVWLLDEHSKLYCKWITE